MTYDKEVLGLGYWASAILNLLYGPSTGLEGSANREKKLRVGPE